MRVENVADEILLLHRPVVAQIPRRQLVCAHVRCLVFGPDRMAPDQVVGVHLSYRSQTFGLLATLDFGAANVTGVVYSVVSLGSVLEVNRVTLPVRALVFGLPRRRTVGTFPAHVSTIAVIEGLFDLVLRTLHCLTFCFGQLGFDFDGHLIGAVALFSLIFGTLMSSELKVLKAFEIALSAHVAVIVVTFSLVIMQELLSGKFLAVIAEIASIFQRLDDFLVVSAMNLALVIGNFGSGLKPRFALATSVR